MKPEIKDKIKRPDLEYPKLKEAGKIHPFLTLEEFDCLEKVDDGSLVFKRVIVARNTAMRPAELTYLCWADLNFDDRTIKIQEKKKDSVR